MPSRSQGANRRQLSSITRIWQSHVRKFLSLLSSLSHRHSPEMTRVFFFFSPQFVWRKLRGLGGQQWTLGVSLKFHGFTWFGVYMFCTAIKSSFFTIIPKILSVTLRNEGRSENPLSSRRVLVKKMLILHGGFVRVPFVKIVSSRIYSSYDDTSSEEFLLLKRFHGARGWAGLWVSSYRKPMLRSCEPRCAH